MTELASRGHVVVSLKSGTMRRFVLEEADAIKDAWRGAKGAFYEGVGPCGEGIVVKVADIDSVCIWSPAALLAYEADDAEERAERMTRGEE